jgi:hypothetical protein
MRLAAFIIALLLLDGAVDPTRGWLIALVVLTGLAALRVRPWSLLHLRPALDLRLASFVLAALLLAGTVEATRDWLIVLSVVTGLAAFMPRLVAIDGPNDDKWSWRYACDWDGDRHERREARRARREERRERRRDRRNWEWEWKWDGDDRP